MHCINVPDCLSWTTYCLNNDLFGLKIYLALNTKKIWVPSSDSGIEAQFSLVPAAGYRPKVLGAEIIRKFSVQSFCKTINDTLTSPQLWLGLEKPTALGYYTVAVKIIPWPYNWCMTLLHAFECFFSEFHWQQFQFKNSSSVKIPAKESEVFHCKPKTVQSSMV